MANYKGYDGPDLDIFHYNSFLQLTAEEKIAQLKKLEEYFAKKEHRPPCEIVIEDKISKDAQGGYQFIGDHKIHLYIDKKILETTLTPCEIDEMRRNRHDQYRDLVQATTLERYNVIDTLIHEGRHAQQDFLVQNPEMAKKLRRDFPADIPDEQEINSWRENMTSSSYLPGDHNEKYIYHNQSIERDAFRYAAKKWDEIFKSQLISDNAELKMSEYVSKDRDGIYAKIENEAKIKLGEKYQQIIDARVHDLYLENQKKQGRGMGEARGRFFRFGLMKT